MARTGGSARPTRTGELGVMVSAVSALATVGISAGVAAAVSLFALWVAGRRQERGRRRELWAAALAATMAYREFPYAIRRRRCEPEHRSQERVRLSEALRLVQQDLAEHQALMRIEDRGDVKDAYTRLMSETRKIAGGYMQSEWKADPIQSDSEVNTEEPFDYSALAKDEDAFVEAVRKDLGWRRPGAQR